MDRNHRLVKALCVLLTLLAISCGGGGTVPPPAPSSITALQGLQVSTGSLAPDFNPDTLAYAVGPVIADSVTVTATALDPGATVLVEGVEVPSGTESAAIPLAMGTNMLNVTVVAPSGATADYEIALDCTSAALTALTATVGPLAPAFDPGTLAYGLDVPALVFSTRLTPTAEDPLATVTVNTMPTASGGASPPIALTGPLALLTVEVTARDGTQQIYVLTATRESSGESKLTASDAASGDYLGISVALDGDTALVGAYADDGAAGGDQGAAYVFVRSGTAWSEQQKLTASDAAAGDYFGYSVALSGDTALVGAHGANSAGSDAGSAYVFVRSGTAWSEQQKLTAADAAAFDLFGSPVALDGDTALVGAHGSDSAGSAAGSAYVFVRAGTAWSEQQKLTASDAAANDRFGYSVALDGDTALVGAWRDDAGASDSGSAYVFVRSDVTWSEQQKLTASDAAAGDHFGHAVALDGDTALVGAWSHDAVGTDSGSAYVFVRLSSTWSEQQKLTPSDAAADDQFGYSVALDGDTALVGATSDADGGDDSGSAYVFTRWGTTWSQRRKLTASDASAYAYFGCDAALDAGTAILGAFGDSSSAGAAYVYR